jgi:hypothetical protein
MQTFVQALIFSLRRAKARACQGTIDGIRAVVSGKPLVTPRFTEILDRVEAKTRNHLEISPHPRRATA